MKIFDRYSLLCVSIALIIIITVFVNQEEPKNEDKIGIVHSIKETQNGYTFMLDDSEGSRMKCFARAGPSEFCVYVVRGSFSEDGNMFFVSSMNMVPQNELYHN
jgi:hypothetical protein